MDIPGLIGNIISTARGIHTMLDQLKSKKEKLQQLKWRVNTLVETLQPFIIVDLSATVDLGDSKPSIVERIFEGHLHISDIFVELAELLGGIRQRASVYGAKFRLGRVMDFVNPGVLLARLEDDERRLSRWIEMFVLKIQVAGFTRNLGLIVSNHAVTSAAKPLAVEDLKAKVIGCSGVAVRDVDSHSSERLDVLTFWDVCIGEEVDLVAPAVFFVGLKGWLKQKLEGMYASILLLVDPEELGVVPRKNVIRLVGEQPLADWMYQIEYGPKHAKWSRDAYDEELWTPEADHQWKPTIVWIDDRVEMVEETIEFAESMGIRVVLFPSTAVAKLWIQANEDHLRRLEENSLLQFVTDNARWEYGENRAGAVLNMTAGETILRFLRGNRFMAPVLVYCGASIDLTTYVREYKSAASTSQPRMCEQFVEHLALGGSVAEEERERALEEWKAVSGIGRGWDVVLKGEGIVN